MVPTDSREKYYNGKHKEKNLSQILFQSQEMFFFTYFVIQKIYVLQISKQFLTLTPTVYPDPFKIPKNIAAKLVTVKM